MSDCVFCKIIVGEIPSVKIWENDEFIAILDIFPNCKGMTLVIPKKHYESYAFDMTDDDYQKLMLATKEVALLLEKGLSVKRVGMIMEGMGINHTHIKLYPMHGLKSKYEEIFISGKYFDEYPGYLTSILGPKANMDELKKIADQIKSI